MPWQCVVVLCVLAALLPTPLRAQGEPARLLLRLRRDWGYDGAGDIQGNFSLVVSGPEDLRRVTFVLDGQSVAEVGQSPWTWTFHTHQFSPGSHVLEAVGHLEDGTELRSNEIRVRFLSDIQAAGSTVRIVVILVGVCGGLLALAGLATLWLSRSTVSQGEPKGNRTPFGLQGGAVCPRCGRPFALHWWAPTTGLSTKLDRCPHCCQWSRVKRAPERDVSTVSGLEAEEAAADPADALTEEEQLRRELEESRYLDL